MLRQQSVASVLHHQTSLRRLQQGCQLPPCCNDWSPSCSLLVCAYLSICPRWSICVSLGMTWRNRLRDGSPAGVLLVLEHARPSCYIERTRNAPQTRLAGTSHRYFLLQRLVPGRHGLVTARRAATCSATVVVAHDRHLQQSACRPRFAACPIVPWCFLLIPLAAFSVGGADYLHATSQPLSQSFWCLSLLVLAPPAHPGPYLICAYDGTSPTFLSLSPPQGPLIALARAHGVLACSSSASTDMLLERPSSVFHV